MPALNGARRSGKEASCISNLRQVMIRMLMYSIDNNDWLMPAGRNAGNYVNQHYSMFLEQNEYGKGMGKNIGICPEDFGLTYNGKKWEASNFVVFDPELYNPPNGKKESPPITGGNSVGHGSGYLYYTSYQTNGMIFGKGHSKSVKITQIKNPGITFAFTDGYNDCIGASEIEGTTIKNATGKGSWGRGQQRLHLRHKRNVVNVYFDGAARKFNGPKHSTAGNIPDYGYVFNEGFSFFDQGAHQRTSGCADHSHDMNDPWGGNDGGSGGVMPCGYIAFSGEK
jgi:hypothetical protein